MHSTGNTPVALVSLVIPARNEAAAISGVLDEVEAVLAGLPVPHEVIVVDDASRDETAAIVALRPGVRLLRNPVNLGYGHSLQRGVALAHGDAIAICDADGSYDLSILPELVGRLQDGLDHVIAERTGSRFHRPFLRRAIYRWLCGYVVGMHVPDANSGLRVFRREVLESVRADVCLGFSFTTSLTLASVMSGYLIEFRRAPFRQRVGRSHVRFRDTLRTAQYLFQLVAAYNPLKLFVPLVAGAAAMALGSALAGIGGAQLWLATAVIAALAALLLVGLGAHAYVVARTAAGPIGARPALRAAPGREPAADCVTAAPASVSVTPSADAQR